MNVRIRVFASRYLPSAPTRFHFTNSRKALFAMSDPDFRQYADSTTARASQTCWFADCSMPGPVNRRAPVKISRDCEVGL